MYLSRETLATIIRNQIPKWRDQRRDTERMDSAQGIGFMADVTFTMPARGHNLPHLDSISVDRVSACAAVLLTCSDYPLQEGVVSVRQTANSRANRSSADQGTAGSPVVRVARCCCDLYPGGNFTCSWRRRFHTNSRKRPEEPAAPGRNSAAAAELAPARSSPSSLIHGSGDGHARTRGVRSPDS
jgi:hypothetical protein